MSGLNKATLIGNIGADPELKYGQSGSAVLRLRMATNESWKDKGGERQERTEWHTVVFFGNRAEGLNRHLRKGSRVYIEGRIQTRQWEDRDGNKRYTTEIVGNELVFCDGKSAPTVSSPERQQQRASLWPQQHRSEQAPASKPGFPADDFGDDDIPF